MFYALFVWNRDMEVNLLVMISMLQSTLAKQVLRDDHYEIREVKLDVGCEMWPVIWRS